MNYKFAVGQEIHSKAIGDVPAFEGRVVARFQNDLTSPKAFYHVDWCGTIWHRDEFDLRAAS